MPSSNFEIRFGSDLHRKVLDALRARRKLSEQEYADAHENWRRSEKQFKAFLPEKASDALRRDKRENEGEPQMTTLVVPYSYAMHMTAHTYLTAVMLSRQPVLQYDGLSGEPEQAVLALEAVMNHQTMIGGHLPVYYNWLLDPGKYSVGWVGYHWDRQISNIGEIQQVPVTFLGTTVPGRVKSQLVRRSILRYEGNTLFNVRPWDAHPDPRVAIGAFQKGEFFIIDTHLAWNTIKEGDYFNKGAVKRFNGEGMALEQGFEATTESLPDHTLKIDSAGDLKDVGRVTIWECYVRLNPKEWGLDAKWDTSELWQFRVANQKVIISARPLGAIHDKFPFENLLHEPGEYELIGRSMYDVLRGMQNTMDWLINSHLYNVRRVMNDQFVVDPSLISMKDLSDPLPGKQIRMLPAGYGQGLLQKAIMQLPVQDVTRGHFMDLSYIADMMQRTEGVTDNVMGMVNQGGRKTATEVRTSSSFGINRLKTIAEWQSSQGWAPLARALMSQTQQWMSAERKFKVAGDFWKAPGAERYIQVSPEDIAGEYDFVPVDGTMPVDRFAQANLWREMLSDWAQNPQLAQSYDLGGIQAWVAQLAGLKNIHQFRIDIAPNEEVEEEVSRGNLVDISEVKSGRGAAERGTSDLARTPEPGQVSGMGTTG